MIVGRLTDSAQNSDLVSAGERDDSREVNRFSKVSDLVSAGEG